MSNNWDYSKQSKYALDYFKRFSAEDCSYYCEYLNKADKKKYPKRPCLLCTKPTDVIYRIYDEEDEEEYGCFEYDENADIPIWFGLCNSCHKQIEFCINECITKLKAFVHVD